ncbi:MAG: hypothetical protein O3A00_06710 [Planctomycetota bacterium]|nr:hypothetical protein [Planctomycetota bacterium]
MKTTTVLLAMLALSTVGCFELETTITIRRDGGATVTERVRFSQRLLDFDVTQGGKIKVADLLAKAAVLDRMKHMGQGIRLKSHEIKDVENGAKESVAVFEIDDIRELRYASPFLAYLDYADNNIVKVNMEPALITNSSGRWRAGTITVWLQPLATPKRDSAPREGDPPPKQPTPLELQKIRQVQPIFKEMMKGMKVKLTFKSYAPLRQVNFGYRGRRSGDDHCDWINFSSDNFDKYGIKFLDNEEVLLELLRGEAGGKNIIEHVAGFANNRTVPVFLGYGSRHGYISGERISFPPSQVLFDRHFAGKMLTFVYEKGPDRTRPASFKEVGEREKKSP